ncbi:LysR substrate-binding domain-containing protein [Dyella sp.]|uniref:LysR substrate-binding domain-containing protein n=1 Tax=Dyella sp. TaxID=1869338 RepID=UPI002B46C14E|nr:LysR substrate-binding domain-containing protein [Dyella sp.]HKT27798.1 LysR substrate-binding domain-containing protein [Dyella sp.]
MRFIVDSRSYLESGFKPWYRLSGAVSDEAPALLRFPMLGFHPSLRSAVRCANPAVGCFSMHAYEEGMLDAALILQADNRRQQGETIFTENFAWIGAPNWTLRPGQPLPLSTQGDACGIRAAAVRALDEAGIAWTEVFIGKGATVVGAAAAAGLAIAVMARGTAPSGTVDVGPALSLPSLPTQEVVLHCALNDRHSRHALRTLPEAFKSLSA